MKRILFMFFLTLTLLVVGGVDGVGQLPWRGPTVWLLDETPNNFGDFWNPFLTTIRNHRIGTNVKIRKDWNVVMNDKGCSVRVGDVWIRLSASPFESQDGFFYMMVYGYVDKCMNTVFVGGGNGSVSGEDDLTYVLQDQGKKYGNEVVDYINQYLGK